ncbi:MAG: ice-binding family protein, partial [Acidobacteriota bacterium]|nr:ice-binding family protein [Acidobacteriota bacterium]
YSAIPISVGGNMKNTLAAVILSTALFQTATAAVAPPLGVASTFGVLGGSAVTNTGLSIVNGDLGVSPGTSITGFPPGVVVGTIHVNDAVAAQAHADATTAYNALAVQACNTVLTGQDLSGKTLTPGVYCFASSAQLTGTLTLDALGDPNAVWVFQIGSTLTTASGSTVNIINGGSSCNVFWQVGSSATLGTTTSFKGNILALASITLTTGASNSGRLLALTGAVTLDTNAVTSCGAAALLNADLLITKTHVGNFTQGQVGATYTITVTNTGTGPTASTVTVVDTLPAGLIATAIAGPGWTCTLGTLTCSRADPLGAGLSYPPITLTVTVLCTAPPLVTNGAMVTSPGIAVDPDDTATDPTIIVPNAVCAAAPDLLITKTHVGSFMQGQVGNLYTITVTNTGTAPTAGTVTVVDTLPPGLVATSIAGPGWTCVLATLTCTRADPLGPGLSYPAITLRVNVLCTAPASVTNTVTVSNPGVPPDPDDTAVDPTIITPGCAPVLDNTYQLRYFANLDKGDSYINVTNAGTLDGRAPAGNICANFYTFDPAEELISCCACAITPNGLASLSVRNDLTSNTLTPGAPTSVTVKLLASAVFGTGAAAGTNISATACDASAVGTGVIGPPNTGNILTRGMRAWATTLHLNTSVAPAPGRYQKTETPFSVVELSLSELAKLQQFCGFIQANGSGFGICKACRFGALGGEQK